MLDRCRRSIRMDKRRTGPQFHALGRDITAFHQRVVSLEYLKGRPVSLAPKAIIAAGGASAANKRKRENSDHSGRNKVRGSVCRAAILSPSCPLWVKSRHCVRSASCPLCQKRTHAVQHKTDSLQRLRCSCAHMVISGRRSSASLLHAVPLAADL